MIFIWGRYKSVKRYGHVADWCPQCASVQALVVTSLGTRPHVYFIPLIPRRELTGILAECACGASWNVDPARYTRMLKEPTTDLAALSAATHPGIAVEAQRQLTLEDRTAAKQLTSEDRVDLMLRAVTSASPAYIVERMNMRFDWPSGLGCLGAIALFALTVILAKDYPVLLAPLLGLFFLSLFACLFLLASRSKRLYRRNVEPRLGALARELGVTPADEGEVISRLKRMRVPIAKVYRPVLPLGTTGLNATAPT